MSKIMLFHSALLTGIFLLVGTGAATGQEKKEKVDLLKGYKRGDRVEIRTEKGDYIKGIVEYVSATRLRLDISLENPNLNGSMTYTIGEISSILSLRQLDKNEIQELMRRRDRNIRERRKRLEEKLMEEESQKEKEEEAEGEGKTDDRDLTLTDDEFVDAMALLKKFPQGETWNDDKKNWLEKKFALTGEPLTEAEQEFVDKYTLWEKAIHYMKSKDQPDRSKKEPVKDEKKNEDDKSSPERKPEKKAEPRSSKTSGS